jgi:hypothetical protein
MYPSYRDLRHLFVRRTAKGQMAPRVFHLSRLSIPFQWGLVLRLRGQTVLSIALSRSQVSIEERRFLCSVARLMLSFRCSGTLCASSECKQPIEGPCLLTPGNSRYHPGHLHCDHRDRYGRHSCRDKMEDYYEVSTMKVCERHKDEALRLMNRLAGTRDAAGRMSVAAKAEKRRTRMIVM